MTTEQIRHVYPTTGDPHRTDLNGTDNLECWCLPRVEIVRDEQERERILGLVVIHNRVAPWDQADQAAAPAEQP